MEKSKSPSISVFVSYSRTDREHAEKLAIALRDRGFKVARDVEDILPTEEWKERLKELIYEADAIVFLLSPRSAVSDVCAWEVEFASSLNKKIAPIVIEDVSGKDIPPMLSRLNYIFATQRDRFENAASSLSDALSTDIDWIREHTRLTSLAIRWDTTQRPAELLLRGEVLESALKWQVDRPQTALPVCDILQEFLNSSRNLKEKSTKYAEQKLLALTALVEHILKRNIDELKKKAKEFDDSWAQAKIRVLSSEANEIRGEIKILENFFAKGGKWHPQPANLIKHAGAEGDYAEVYQFPCCGAYAVLKDEGIPMQFRGDGCEEQP